MHNVVMEMVQKGRRGKGDDNDLEESSLDPLKLKTLQASSRNVVDGGSIEIVITSVFKAE